MASSPSSPDLLAAALTAFEEGVVELSGRRLPYRLLRPDPAAPGTRYPVILFLHGAGERGEDNRRQLVHFPSTMLSPTRRRDAPCFVLAPQCPEDARWVEADWSAPVSAPMKPEPSLPMRAAFALLETLLREPTVDPDRVYLTGLSMGGYGAWEMASRRPDLFAALAPVCGGGDETRAASLRHLPIWTFHGSDDPVVPVVRTRRMVAALRDAGASPRYTEIPGGAHDAWTDAYGPEALIPWMMAQLRDGAPLTPADEARLAPRTAWSGVSIDCARQPQSVETLEQVVDLCGLLGLRSVQLHLTDDEAFTFPSLRFPEVVSPGRGYDREELVALQERARLRGVQVVPEIDLPGHAAALVRARPDLFGLDDPARNPSLINLGREETLRAVETLIDEVCDLFSEAPFVHLGGDEVDDAGLLEDPHCRSRMKAEGLASSVALQRGFLSRLSTKLRERGRRLVVWEGAPVTDPTGLPDDLVVVAWDAASPPPATLLAAGHAVVNASFRPLYVVGGGRSDQGSEPRAWPAEEILRFEIGRFDHWDPEKPAYGGLRVAADEGLLGAQLCLWEQAEWSVMPSLTARLVALTLALSREGASVDEEESARLERITRWVRGQIQPVRIHPPQPELAPAHTFHDAVEVAMAAAGEGVIRYTRDASLPAADAPIYEGPFTLRETTTLRARRFDADGQPRGGSTWARYERTPAPPA